MLLAFLELELCALASGAVRFDILAIDEVVARGRWTVAGGGVVFLEDCLSVPIVDHDRSYVNVPIRRGRPVDDDGAKHTGTILGGEVRVIPGTTVRRGLKSVGLLVARSDGTLSDARNTVSIVGVELAKAVPMNASAVVLELVDDGYLDIITPVGLQKGAGVLTIDQQHDF